MSSPPSFTSSTDLNYESIGTLKRWLAAQGVASDDCLEKSELVERVRKTLDYNPCSCSSSSHCHSSPSSAGSSSDFVYRTIAVGPLACNLLIVADKRTNEAMLIDPGGDEDKIIALIKEMNVKVILILLTHAHFDHFLALAAIKEYTGAPVAFHSQDAMLYNALPIQCAMIGYPPPKTQLPKQDIALTDQYKLPLADGIVFHTPGHSPGSVSFYFPPLNLLSSGDTLFRRSVGRTDLMGGDNAAIIRSIQDKLYALPDNTEVIPGHNEKTTIGEEKRSNSAVKAKI